MALMGLADFTAIVQTEFSRFHMGRKNPSRGARTDCSL